MTEWIWGRWDFCLVSLVGIAACVCRHHNGLMYQGPAIHCHTAEPHFWQWQWQWQLWHWKLYSTFLFHLWPPRHWGPPKIFKLFLLMKPEQARERPSELILCESRNAQVCFFSYLYYNIKMGLEGESLARFWASRVTDEIHHSMLSRVSLQNILSSLKHPPQGTIFLFRCKSRFLQIFRCVRHGCKKRKM